MASNSYQWLSIVRIIDIELSYSHGYHNNAKHPIEMTMIAAGL